MKNNFDQLISRILFYGSVLLLFFAVMTTCHRMREENEMADESLMLIIENQRLNQINIKKDRDLKNFKDSVYESMQVIISNEVAKKLSVEKTLGVDKPRIIVQTRIVTKIDSFFVETKDTIKVSEDLNLPFETKTDYYTISGKVRKNGVLFDSLYFPSKLTWSLGTDKKGFFKPKESVVRVSSNNPYVNIKGMDNFVVKNEKKWYQSGGFWVGAGFLSGILTTSLLLK
jgi:hypothetical protein